MCCRRDTGLRGGPVVVQATHFVDLIWFFAVVILEDMFQPVAVGPDHELSEDEVNTVIAYTA